MLLSSGSFSCRMRMLWEVQGGEVQLNALTHLKVPGEGKTRISTGKLQKTFPNSFLIVLVRHL